MKNVLILISAIFVLFLLIAVGGPTVRAETGTATTTPTLDEIIDSLLAEVAILQQKLNDLILKSVATPAPSAPATTETEITFVPDGSTFGLASKITSIRVAPSNVGESTITMTSDKNEVVVSEILNFANDVDDDGDLIEPLTEYPYGSYASYDSNSSFDNDELIVVTGERISEVELLESLIITLDYDALLADNVKRFLLENPVYYRGRTGRDNSAAYECYESEDEEMIIDVMRRILDKGNFLYDDLDEIVSFVPPMQLSESSSYYYNGQCYGEFDNTLEEVE